MIFIVLGLGALFFSLGYLVTESNASMLLSGYNTMNSEDQKSFPLKEYLVDFKRFHQWFGIGFTALGLLLYVLNENWLGYHLGISPLLAYLHFFWRTRRFSLNQSKNTKNQFWIGLAVLLFTLVFVVGMLFWSERENTVVWTDKSIEIEGPYGVVIPFEQIESLELLDELPEISSRLHGYSTGSTVKGKFKGPMDVRYHLLLDKPFEQVLALYPYGGMPILISLNGVNEKTLFLKIKNNLNPE